MANDSRTFLITGASTGIGAELARQANAAGHRVFLTARSEERLAAVHGELDPDTAAFQPTDHGDWAQTESAVQAAVERFGGLDVAVANAGHTVQGNFADGDPEAWRQMVLVNVLGPALTAKAALPHLERTGGRLLLVGSVVGHKIPPGSLYSATKHAVTAMAESLRMQVTGTVGVTLIAPGRTETPFWSEPQNEPMLDPASVAAAMLWAATRPADVDVNEVMLRPPGQAA